jgi:hypothetical protein
VVKRASDNFPIFLNSVYRGGLALLCWLFVELYRDLRADISTIKSLVETDRVAVATVKAIQESHSQRITGLEQAQRGKP